jgi:hypothetical protein
MKMCNFLCFLNYRTSNYIKKECRNFFCMKFYHDKTSMEKQEIMTFPVADTFDLVGFRSLNERIAFWIMYKAISIPPVIMLFSIFTSIPTFRRN